MQGQLSSMLLCGAAAVAMISVAAAQTASSAKQTPPKAAKYPIDLSLTYAATSSSAVGGSNFWMQGAAVQVHVRLHGGLGAAAGVSGAHTANIGPSGVGLDMVTLAFGPRYTWSPAHIRSLLFVQGMLGQSYGFHSVFPGTAGATGSAHSLAAEVGGGVNFTVSPRLGLRLCEAEWQRTQLPNSAANVQNNLRISAGLVFRIHGGAINSKSIQPRGTEVQRDRERKFDQRPAICRQFRVQLSPTARCAHQTSSSFKLGRFCRCERLVASGAQGEPRLNRGDASIRSPRLEPPRSSIPDQTRVDPPAADHPGSCSIQ
jgi:hypothetical protein